MWYKNIMVKILGIAGSLREGSFNKGVLRAASENLPPDTQMEIADISDIPVFNQDTELPQPASVKVLKEKIVSADALYFATPEYNNSMSGVMKNVIDWGSRPMGDNSWDSKPAAIVSASPSRLGGVKAQLALRQTFIFLNIHDIKQPEVVIANAMQLFDDNGDLKDEDTKKRIATQVEALVEFAKKLT